MKNSYSIVNPFIKGNFKNEFTGKNINDVCKKAYSHISQYFNNNIPVFYFSIQNQKTKDLHHFKVTESKKVSGKGKYDVNMNVEQIETSSKNESRFLKKFASCKKHNKQRGGYEDDDSSSSSDSDYLYTNIDRRKTSYLSNNSLSPLAFWWYDPHLYRMKKFYIPTFYGHIYPYIEVDLYL